MSWIPQYLTAEQVLVSLVDSIYAVLFLLLLSGESLKWAKLTSGQQQLVSDMQVILTTGVVIAVALYGFCQLGFMKRFLRVSSALANYEQAFCTFPIVRKSA